MKVKVNISNYEVWMIDYFDGKLNATEIAELMAFIKEHPNINEEFETFENIGLNTIETTYASKEELKKEPIKGTSKINEENYDEYFVAYYEGDLSASEQTELLSFVELNPALTSEFEFHGKLLLSDNPDVVFAGKPGLKRKAVIGVYWQVAGVAATILILFGLFSLFDFGNSSSQYRLDNKIILSELQSKTIGIDLKQKTKADIIAKQLQFIKVTVLDEETPRNNMIALNNLTAQSPNLTINKPIDYPELSEYRSGYFDFSNALADIDQPKRKNAFGRVIQNLSRRVAGKIPVVERVKSKDEPTFVKALGRSITVFNTITGSDTELVKAYDQNGNLTGYYVEGETIAWSRDIASNKE